MIKIKALNECEESSSDDCTQTCLMTREAQEEGLYQLYWNALKTLSSGDEELAKQMLLKLNDNLNNKSVQQKAKEESFINRLRYLTLKNLGLITNDLNYFLDALEFDCSDVSLWIKTGQRAALLLNYQLSRNCYESAYNLSPYNWIVIDRLIDNYFILHDLYNCYRICCVALDRDNTYRKAICVLNECLRLNPPFLKDLDQKYKQFIDNDYQNEEFLTIIGNLRQLKLKRHQHFEDERAKQEAKRPKLTLVLENRSNLTFASIGIKLRNLFERIKKSNIFPSTPIDISFDSGYSSQTDSGGNESGSANTSADESTTAVAVERIDKEKENVKEFKRSNSLRNSTSNSFPTEFIDKRRSSRVKNILNKSRDIDERNVSESILELLPESIKNALKEDITDTKADEEIQETSQKCSKTSETSETENIKLFVEKLKSIKSLRKVIRIYDLIETYLCELSSCKNIAIPSVFSELYIIYRENCELPCGPLTVIGKDIELEQIWMCLTANELKFNRNEALFLTQMMTPLEFALSKEKYIEYIVRLSMIRGTKENNKHFLNYALDILSENDIEVMASNRVSIKYSSIKSILESQSRESMTQMMTEQNFEGIIKILMSKPESELTLDEIKLLNDAIINSKLWQKGIEILSTRNDLSNECLSTIRKCLETGKRARLTHQLAVKLVKLAAEGYSVLPWICLYWGIIAEGVVANNSKSNIIKFSKLGHHYLGKRGTCTSHNGEFLLLALQHFIEFDVEDEILKCFTCLYNFPTRRIPNSQSSSVANIHTSPNIKLKWEHCEALYHYFAPEELPEYDSLIRQTGITQDIEALLLRIVELVPENLQPSKHSEAILRYIEKGDEIPADTEVETSHITETLYYLLADYYFKNKEFKKARQYYILDLSLNPTRFDSWAGSALSRSYQLDQQLLSGENIDSQFYRQTYATLRCFDRALKLESSNTKLWIEYGHFVYNISSNASRIRKTSLFITQTEFKIESEDMIKIARNCFECANNTESADEVWLPYYMLGKVMEKSGHLLAALRYYEWAELCLYVEGTSYPKKIQYHNPPYLAVEALEIHYRIHAATLKYLTLNKKFSSRILKRIKVHLIRALRSPFSKQLTPSSATSVAPMDHDYATAGILASTSNSLSNDSVSELINDILDVISEREKKIDSNKLKEELVSLCLNAMKRCLNRYPAHYKSIYRLAHFYHSINDNMTAKQLLLGSASNTYKNVPQLSAESEITDGNGNIESAKLIPGLFAERKTNNLFNGIWRIPIDDIDRPGSFNAHMFRSTFLLIRVCTFTNDYQTLCTIALQLSRTPDVGKRYLRDSDRQVLARFSFESCNILLKSHLESPLNFSRDKIINDIQKIVERFIKANVFVNEANALFRDILQMSRK